MRGSAIRTSSNAVLWTFIPVSDFQGSVSIDKWSVSIHPWEKFRLVTIAENSERACYAFAASSQFEYSQHLVKNKPPLRFSWSRSSRVVCSGTFPVSWSSTRRRQLPLGKSETNLPKQMPHDSVIHFSRSCDTKHSGSIAYSLSISQHRHSIRVIEREVPVWRNRCTLPHFHFNGSWKIPARREAGFPEACAMAGFREGLY